MARILSRLTDIEANNILYNHGKFTRIFDAHALKFNFDYQRTHNPGRGVQVYMKNVKEIQVIDPYTVRMTLDKPDSLFLDKIILGPIAGSVIGAPKYMERVGWDEFLKRPVGTGPYMVEGVVKDHRKVPP